MLIDLSAHQPNQDKQDRQHALIWCMEHLVALADRTLQSSGGRAIIIFDLQGYTMDNLDTEDAAAIVDIVQVCTRIPLRALHLYMPVLSLLKHAVMLVHNCAHNCFGQTNVFLPWFLHVMNVLSTCMHSTLMGVTTGLGMVLALCLISLVSDQHIITLVQLHSCVIFHMPSTVLSFQLVNYPN